MISLKIGGIIVAAFIAGAFVASPELRAYAANTIGSSDIIDESILSQDIKNGEVKNADLGTSAVTNSKIASSAVTTSKIADGTISAADLGPDSVGASEIKGVTKLIFANCTYSPGSIPAGSGVGNIPCSATGVAAGDNAIGTVNSWNGCIFLTKASGYELTPNTIVYDIANICATAQDPGTLTTSIIVYK